MKTKQVASLNDLPSAASACATVASEKCQTLSLLSCISSEFIDNKEMFLHSSSKIWNKRTLDKLCVVYLKS